MSMHTVLIVLATIGGCVVLWTTEAALKSWWKSRPVKVTARDKQAYDKLICDLVEADEQAKSKA